MANKQPTSHPRHIILEIEDTKTKLIQDVNNALDKGLPCYLIRDILDNIISKLRDGVEAELAAARAQETDSVKTIDEEVSN